MLQSLQNIKINMFIRTYYTQKKCEAWGWRRFHWHDFYQLVYVRRGSGALIIGDTTYPLCSTDAILIRPNEAHVFTTSEKMETYEVKFVFPEGCEDSLLQSQLRVCRDVSGGIKQALRQIEAESELIDPFSRSLTTLSLTRALLLMYRTLADADGSPRENAQEGPDIMLEQVNAYIDRNMSRRFTVKEMAAWFFVGYTHFSRRFSVKYGIRLQQYINQRRVARAKDMLTATNLSMTEIASKCGFENLSNLERNFKQAEGISPTQYRQYFQNVRVVTFEECPEIHHIKEP